MKLVTGFCLLLIALPTRTQATSSRPLEFHCQNDAPVAVPDSSAKQLPPTESTSYLNALMEPELQAGVTGINSILIVRVSFADDPVSPASLEEVTTMMDEVNQFYEENSYGQFSWSPVFTPVLQLPLTISEYLAHPDRFHGFRAAALEAAAISGYPVEEFAYDMVINRHLYAYRATVGGAGCWLQGADTDAAIHELGHNLGLGHANLWVGRGDTIIGDGHALPYGNAFDAMADRQPGSWPQRHFNTAHKYKLGWLPDTHVLDAAQDGMYRLHAFDSSHLQNSAHHAIRIPKSEDREYWLEIRDQWDDNYRAERGLLLYFGAWDESFGTSPLLDTTPNSHWAEDSRDAPLMPGRTFSDPDSGLHVTPIFRSQSSPSYMDVLVKFGPFPFNQSPVLHLNISQEEVATTQKISLQATASDPDGDPVYLSWEFGDGTFGDSGNDQEKQWSKPGDYLVRCWVSDGKGGTSMQQRMIRVGQTQTKRLKGRITRNGHPVVGARVSVTDSLVGYTDAQGYYMVPGLTNGMYQLHPGLAYHGFEPVDRVVEILNGPVENADFSSFTNATPNNPPYIVSRTTSGFIQGNPGDVSLSAWAYDDGLVKQVYFLSSTNLAVMGRGDGYTEIWTNIWTAVPTGYHTVTIHAVDDFGVIGQSLPVQFLVGNTPPAITSIRRQADGAMLLDMAGDPGQVVAIEASTNLLDWRTVARQTNTIQQMQWTDLQAPDLPRRFYRLKAMVF